MVGKLSPNGTVIATGGSEGILRLWKVRYDRNNINGVVFDRQMNAHLEKINGIAFNLTGELVFSASSDRTCRVYNVKDGRQIHCLSLSIPNIGRKLEFRAC